MVGVGFIGVRDGETLISSPKAKQNRGSIMKIKGFFPPLNDWLKNIESSTIRDQLNLYQFFAPMSVEERTSWLNSHGADGDLYLQDVPLQVKFVSLSGEFVSKNLTPAQIDIILRGNPADPEGYWPITDVYNMFPKKPGSRAKRHTLIFRPGNWDVQSDLQSVQAYSGIYIDSISGTIHSGIPSGTFHIVPIAEARKQANPSISEIAILANNTQKTKWTLDQLLPYINITSDIVDIISWCSPSVHKSLIQKILRTRCTHVFYVDTEYPAEEVLLASFCLLLVHPGAFVPNIQRFVTGTESALKRLAVSIFEDAYCPDGNAMLTLLTGAWLAQNVSSWIPTLPQITQWFQLALDALHSPHMYRYDFHNTPGIITEWSSWFASFYMLSAIRSFPSDELMVCSIAENNGAQLGNDIREKRVMPLVHCIDQHCYTAIAHYFPYEIVSEIGDYGQLFKRIWQEVSSKNPRKELGNSSIHSVNSPKRKENFDFMRGSPFFTATRAAQNLTWISRMYTPQKSEDFMRQTIELNYKLHDGWLASFVGPKEIRIGASTAICIMHPDNIHTYVAVKRPSREMSVPELTEAEKEIAIASFRQMLILGVQLTNIPSTLSMFSGCRVTLREDEYIISGSLNGPWDQVSFLELNFPLLPEIPIVQPLYQSLTITGDGIRNNAEQVFSDYLLQLDPNVIRRALSYLSYDSQIDLHHISRDGSGTEYSVSVTDTGVNWLLAMITILYPAALVSDNGKYKVKNGPLMWTLANKIRSLLPMATPYEWNRSEACLQGDKKFCRIPTPETRQLWDHQLDAIDNLLHSDKRLKIIWIPPGLGKTAIVVNYIATLILENRMPKYAVYTLPPSAISTIQRELSMRSIPFVHLDMRQSAGGEKGLVPGHVNLIYHDHLRMAPNLKNFANEMLFVVDEFHKTLNATIRTSVTLELAHLAADVIAMTGTLIKDTHVEPVIAWLSQSVDFEVTTKNYWVALSSIISRKVYTKIVVERIVQEAEMTSEERRRYYELVPAALGGTAVNINFKEAVNVSYLAITRRMIEIIMFHIPYGGVFVVARNREHAGEIERLLRIQGVNRIFTIGPGKSINLTPTFNSVSEIPQVVIATTRDAEGYSLSLFNVMVTGVYFSNEATREQLERRINRLDSVGPSIRIVVIHAGVISYIHNNYEKARSLSEALKGFAKDVKIEGRVQID